MTFINVVIATVDILTLFMIVIYFMYFPKDLKKRDFKLNKDEKTFIKRIKRKRNLTEEEKRDMEILELIENYDGKKSVGRRESE